VLKKYIREKEKEDLVSEPEEVDLEKVAERLFFGWKQEVRRYRRMGK
jgi:hypothetical protein